MITSKQAARLRHKRKSGETISAKANRELDEYEAMRVNRAAAIVSDATSEAGDPPAPAPEVAPPDSPPDVPQAAPEAPPVVKLETPQTASGGVSWQDKYKKQMAVAGMDGREALCVFIGSQWVSALEAMEADLALVNIEPVIPAKALFPVIVIALDQLLPDRARLTPPIAAAVGSSVTAVQRFKHHKKIVEAQKKDPSIQEYKRKQAEEAEAKARAERVAKAAEAGIKSVPDEPIKTAEPPPSSPPPSIDHTPSSKPTSSSSDEPNVAVGLGLDRAAPGVDLKGRPVI